MHYEDVLRDLLYKQISIAIATGHKGIKHCFFAIDARGEARWGPADPDVKPFYKATVSINDGVIRIDSFEKSHAENLN